MLQIRKITRLGLSIVLLGCFPALTFPADVTLPQIIIPGLGMTSWEITNDGGTNTGQAFNGICDGSPGLTINDAIGASGNTNAFDTAYQIYVDGQVFVAPDHVDVTGNIMTAGPAMVGIADLPVTVEYLFSDTVQAARIRYLFENTSPNPIDITVEVPVNFGSDAATTIEATASGDLNFTENDRWLVTSDGGPGDPVNTTVLFGPDNPPETPTMVTMTVCENLGTEGAGMTFEITIPANSTRSLMFFAGLGDIQGVGNTVAGAITNATMFDNVNTIDPSLVGDLSDTERLETLNWRLESLPLTIIPGLGMTEWVITNNGGSDMDEAFLGKCDGTTPGLTLYDATGASGDTDAFDTAYQLFVNDRVFVAPDPVDVTGNVMTAGPAMVGIADLPVTVEYLFSDTVQAARIRYIFENTSGDPIDMKVDVPINFGSDAATIIEATASGDQNFTENDRWLVTSDGVPDDPVNTTVLFGPDNPLETPTMVTTTVCENGGTEGAGMTFEITIPANSTRTLIFFAGLGDIRGVDNTVDGAITNAAMFDNPETIDASLVGDLSDADWDRALNWRLIREGVVVAKGVSTGGGGGGGGGCTLQSPRSVDPLFPVLLAGLAFLALRRRCRRQLT